MLDTGSDKAKRKALEEGNKGEHKKKWMEAIFNQVDLRDKPNSLSFAQKQILLKNLFEDGSLKMYLIARDKMPNIPPDEHHGDCGIFFGEKSKKVGVEIRIDLELNSHKILNTIHYNNITQ